MSAASKVLDTAQFLWDCCSLTKLLEVPSVFRFLLDTGSKGSISLVEFPWHYTAPVCGLFLNYEAVPGLDALGKPLWGWPTFLSEDKAWVILCHNSA